MDRYDDWTAGLRGLASVGASMQRYPVLEPTPYLTADQPGIGGAIKRRPEDFVVAERPLFEPAGAGDFLYLWVRKRRRLTTDVSRLIAEHFEVPMASIGFAGLKDKHAVAHQAITVPSTDLDRAADFHDSAIHILQADRHDRPIERGNLLGNHFDIKVRHVEPAHVVRAKAILDRLGRDGVPNFAGEQRFGYRRTNHLMGMFLLQQRWDEFLDELLGRPVDGEPPYDHAARRAYEAGHYTEALSNWTTVHRFERQAIGPLSRGASPREAISNIDLTQRQLLVSAFQSSIFNRMVRRRLEAGTLGTLIDGDVAYIHETRRIRRVTDPHAEQPRCDAHEISPTGPMWGATMIRADRQVDQYEKAELDATGVSLEQLAAKPYGVPGSRKPLRMFVTEIETTGGADDFGPYVRCRFFLPRGCFATIVMGEVMKTP